MARQDLIETASKLEQKIARSGSAGRLALQPEFARVLEQLAAGGQKVPPRLRRLNTTLRNEAVEAGFDNMPV